MKRKLVGRNKKHRPSIVYKLKKLKIIECLSKQELEDEQ